jgi:FKBP-type peptidyl-prolyl cis-trans isomerase FkpA
MANNVRPFGLSPAEFEMVTMGLEDGVTGKEPRVELREYGPKVQEMARARVEVRAQAAKDGSRAFLVQAAREEGAVKTPSGLIFRTLKPGTGQSPTAEDTVRVHYRGALTDGTEFDSSRKRGEPVEFPLGGVIGCWTEGLQRMKVGEQAQLVCPSAIAYGDLGRPPTIPGGATLVFDVELLAIKGQ